MLISIVVNNFKQVSCNSNLEVNKWVGYNLNLYDLRCI